MVLKMDNPTFFEQELAKYNSVESSDKVNANTPFRLAYHSNSTDAFLYHGNAFDLMDEVEKKLGLQVTPLSFPIGMGYDFQGIDRAAASYTDTLSLVTSTVLSDSNVNGRLTVSTKLVANFLTSSQ